MRQKVKFAGISARCAVAEDELRLDVRYAAVRVLFAVFRTFLGSVKVRLWGWRVTTDRKRVFESNLVLKIGVCSLMVAILWASTRTYTFHNLRRNPQLVYLVNKRRSGVGLHIKYVNSVRVEWRQDEAISFLVWISVTAARKSVNVRKVFFSFSEDIGYFVPPTESSMTQNTEPLLARKWVCQ